MRPDQLGDYRIPSDARIHPDGRHVAFVVTRMDLEDDRYVRRIWLWNGETARPFTAGPADTRPRWSPDGTRLLFLRTDDDDAAKPQIAVMPFAGGEAGVVTDFELGVLEAEWSPDGSLIAAVVPEWLPSLAGLDEEERGRRPRRFTRIPYRFDNQGWTGARRQHVWVVDPAASDQRCVTPGDFDESGVVWHPDGSELAFLSSRHESRELDPGVQIFSVDLATGDLSERTPVGTWGTVSYDRSGRLHGIGDPDPWAFPGVPRLRRIDEDLTDLTGHLDRSVSVFSPPVAPAGPQWLEDGSALSILEDEGAIRVIRIGADGVAADVIGGPRVITGVSPRPDGSAFAFTATTPTDPGELWWWSDGVETRLTSLNASFRSEATLAEPTRFTVDHDGVSVEGWAYLPEGDARVPVLLNIHGGPATQYGYGFFDEFQVYTGAGYGVVSLNPRGSSGYGHDHVSAVVGRWHEDMPPDLADLLAAVDAAGAVEPRLDTGRVGVMGGSYGGLMTLRVCAADGRFASAVAERGLYSWGSFAGTSDIGMWFGKAYLGVDLFDDPQRYWASGPLALSQSVTTPMLVVHSEGDYRTPVEQGEQLFAALKRAGVETEFVRFPGGEGHELSRSGKPRHRKERFEIILDWHARHLGSGG